MFKKTDYLVVIPARYQSKRLKGKPLIKIHGIPMIIRTFNRCLKVFPKSKIFVATDDYRIKETCKKYNVNAVMTSKNCLTGTDRIAEFSKKYRAKFYINVQGDEPLCNVNDLKKLFLVAKRNPNKIINGYTSIKERKLFYSGNIPKVVFRNDGRLLYQSRAPIPTTKEKKFVKSWRQVCIYSLPFGSLKKFTSVRKKTKLEELEDCELLRFLELGLEVYMIKMSDKSVAVDTPQDLKKVKKILKK